MTSHYLSSLAWAVAAADHLSFDHFAYSDLFADPASFPAHPYSDLGFDPGFADSVADPSTSSVPMPDYNEFHHL